MDWFSTTNSALAGTPRDEVVYPEVIGTVDVPQYALVFFDTTYVKAAELGRGGDHTILNQDHPFNFCRVHDVAILAKVKATGAINFGVLNATDGDTFVLDDGINPPITFTFSTTLGTITQTPTSREIEIGGSIPVTGANVVLAVNSTAITLNITATQQVPPNDEIVDFENDNFGTVGNVAITDGMVAHTPTGMSGGLDAADGKIWGIAQESSKVGEKCRVMLRGVTLGNGIGGVGTHQQFGEFSTPENSASTAAPFTLEGIDPPVANAPVIIPGRAWADAAVSTSDPFPAPPFTRVIRYLFDGLYGMGIQLG